MLNLICALICLPVPKSLLLHLFPIQHTLKLSQSELSLLVLGCTYD